MMMKLRILKITKEKKDVTLIQTPLKDIHKRVDHFVIHKDTYWLQQ